MLGLAVLFGLAVWVAITIGAVFLGAKALKIWWAKPYAGLLGGFLGFMLTMGGFIVYWAVEYIQIQRTVTHLCETEGGITVYVTPEEWRKQIGEEEWGKLKSLTDEEIRESSNDKNEVEYNNKLYRYSRGIYRAGNLENSRIKLFDSYQSDIPFIIANRTIVVDVKTGQILISASYINAGAGSIDNGLSGLKFWMSNLSKCPEDFYREFHLLVKQYSNTREDYE